LTLLRRVPCVPVPYHMATGDLCAFYLVSCVRIETHSVELPASRLIFSTPIVPTLGLDFPVSCNGIFGLVFVYSESCFGVGTIGVPTLCIGFLLCRTAFRGSSSVFPNLVFASGGTLRDANL